MLLGLKHQPHQIQHTQRTCLYVCMKFSAEVLSYSMRLRTPSTDESNEGSKCIDEMIAEVVLAIVLFMC